jgi:hypothetical protein
VENIRNGKEKVLNFVKKIRADYEAANRAKDLYEDILNQKCDLCKEKEWSFVVNSDDDEASEYISRFGRQEGYALTCDDCFNKNFDQYPWKFGAFVL